MSSAVDAVSLGVLALVGYRLVSAARVAVAVRGRARVVTIARGLRWRHVWPAPLLLVAVGAVASALLALVPPLAIGWWSLLGGEGNPAFGSSSVTRGTAWERWLPLVFVVLLIPALPLFAQREEEIFRLGAERRTRRQRAMRSLAFGLVHALVGIPVGVALALSVGGAYFTHRYLRAWHATHDREAAVMESTRVHVAYNAFIVVIVLTVIALA